jgi:hypothetical protein
MKRILIYCSFNEKNFLACHTHTITFDVKRDAARSKKHPALNDKALGLIYRFFGMFFVPGTAGRPDERACWLRKGRAPIPLAPLLSGSASPYME